MEGCCPGGHDRLPPRWTRDANGHEVDTGWTSLTFVLDKKGVVRHVHPGGQYVDGDAAFKRLRAIIERLLAEDSPRSR